MYALRFILLQRKYVTLEGASVFQRKIPSLLRYLSQTNIVVKESLATVPPENVQNEKDILAKRFKGLEKNIWIEFTALAVTHNAVNLGQGFIDYLPPQYVIDFYRQCIDDSNILLYQYTRGFGHRRLVDAIAQVYSKYFFRELDPLNQILVTSGAYPSLFNAINGLVNPGDEVILIEPFFDCYEPMVKATGGIARCIALKPKSNSTNEKTSSSADWILDENELESMFNKKTKAIIVNSPNNPLGKVFTQQELEKIAGLCQKHNVYCISDEVYEWIVYPGHKHIRIATLPNMWERTLTIGSAGKTFSSTGFKIGWTIGPEKLIRACQIVHQNCVYTNPTMSQEVVARCFEHELKRLNSPDCYFNSISNELLEKRDRIVQVLKECGMKPIVPDGGYFILADWTKFNNAQFHSDNEESKDFKFVKYLTKEKHLATIPASGFYTKDHIPMADKYIRFCFAKKDETIEKAIKILKNL